MDKESLRLLLSKDLPYLRSAVEGASDEVIENASYAHSWSFVMEVSKLLEVAKIVVEEILREHNEPKDDVARGIVTKMVTYRGKKGRLLDIALPELKQILYNYGLICGRYEFESGVPIHKTHTAVVYFAKDLKAQLDGEAIEAPRVALKFMRNKDQFQRELAARGNIGSEFRLNTEYVVSAIRKHMKGREEPYYSGDFDHLLVMEAADFSLHTIIHTQKVSKNWREVVPIARELVMAVDSMHQHGLVHADLKPLNVVKIGGKIKLIDFDASVKAQHDFACQKYSSAYLAPELLYEDEDEGKIFVREAANEKLRVKATLAHDMWALGVILYHLTSGAPIFVVNSNNDSLGQADLRRVCNWGENIDLKNRLLDKIPLYSARNLVSKLLAANPRERPASMSAVLAHSFFAEPPQFDIFISYRRGDLTNRIAEDLYNLFASRSLVVFLDRESIQVGDLWENKFVDVLSCSKLFLPICDRKGIKDKFDVLDVSSSQDNVLLEHRICCELQALGFLQGIIPLFIGDEVEHRHGGGGGGGVGVRSFTNYFASGCAPNTQSPAIPSVEKAVSRHMSRLELPASRFSSDSVRETLGKTCSEVNGFFIQGARPLEEQLAEFSEKVLHKVFTEQAVLSEEQVPLEAENMRLRKQKREIQEELDALRRQLRLSEQQITERKQEYAKTEKLALPVWLATTVFLAAGIVFVMSSSRKMSK